MDFVALISNAFAAVGKYFGWAQDRQSLKNSPAVVKAAVAVDQQATLDDESKELASEDVDAIRKRLADPNK